MLLYPFQVSRLAGFFEGFGQREKMTNTGLVVLNHARESSELAVWRCGPNAGVYGRRRSKVTEGKATTEEMANFRPSRAILGECMAMITDYAFLAPVIWISKSVRVVIG
jgi:hypothetical protein